jgi:hypothetical protein
LILALAVPSLLLTIALLALTRSLGNPMKGGDALQ